LLFLTGCASAFTYPTEAISQGGVWPGNFFQLPTLPENPWRADILQVTDNTIFFSGGPSQGLRIGDLLQVETPGVTIVNRSGQSMTLPGRPVAQVKVASFFGRGPTEGAVAVVTSGVVRPQSAKSLVVMELHQ